MVLPLLATLALQGGLKKTDVVPGKGDAAKPGDVVVVDYTGTLANGTKFDSSVGRAPFVFALGAGSVIKGWDLGVAGMRAGGRRKLTIPPALGYGPNGTPGGPIPGNATLVFDVELRRVLHVPHTTTKAGRGPAAGPRDSVTIEYTGMLKNGTVFDTSRGKRPFTFDVGGQVVPGFSAGVLGMKAGEKRRITIPAEAGYGARAIGTIPANSDLVFDIELVSLRKAAR